MAAHGLFGCSGWSLVVHGLLGRACRPCNNGMTPRDVHNSQGMREETWVCLAPFGERWQQTQLFSRDQVPSLEETWSLME